MLFSSEGFLKLIDFGSADMMENELNKDLFAQFQ